MAAIVELAFRRALATAGEETETSFPAQTILVTSTFIQTTSPSNSLSTASTGSTEAIPSNFASSTDPPFTEPPNPYELLWEAGNSSPSTDTKIGLGLGIPFAFVVMGIVGMGIYLYLRKKRQLQRTHHHLVPNSDKDHTAEVRAQGDSRNVDRTSQDESKDFIHELHGTEVTIPSRPRELEGSPGIEQQELPTRRVSKPTRRLSV